MTHFDLLYFRLKFDTNENSVARYYYLFSRLDASPPRTVEFCVTCVALVCWGGSRSVSSSFIFFFFPMQTQDVTLSGWRSHTKDMIISSWHVTCINKPPPPECLCTHLCLLKRVLCRLQLFRPIQQSWKCWLLPNLILKVFDVYFSACATLPKCRTFHYLDQLSFHWCLLVVFGKLVGL